MSIHRYKGDVFTHGGQTTVLGFGAEIMAAQTALKTPVSLTVYVGYHGKADGSWDRDFSAQEDADTNKIGFLFPNAKLVSVRKPGMSDDDIRQAVKAGNVFFTWCDSDAKVTKVMGAGMPALA